MDFELTDEQRLIVETVRDFVRNELYPHEAELGGGGLDAVSMVLVERELGRAGYALQMLVERPSNILLACEGVQRSRYLLPAIRGERHDCVAMTEPGAGSDVRSMTTSAV